MLPNVWTTRRSAPTRRNGASAVRVTGRASPSADMRRARASASRRRSACRTSWACAASTAGRFSSRAHHSLKLDSCVRTVKRQGMKGWRGEGVGALPSTEAMTIRNQGWQRGKKILDFNRPGGTAASKQGTEHDRSKEYMGLGTCQL
eukprot:358392-Chlamydomonas_euryale.AAC.11